MADRINREDALQRISDHFHDFLIKLGYEHGYIEAKVEHQWYCDGLMAAMEILMDMPTEQ